MRPLATSILRMTWEQPWIGTVDQYRHVDRSVLNDELSGVTAAIVASAVSIRTAKIVVQRQKGKRLRLLQRQSECRYAICMQHVELPSSRSEDFMAWLIVIED